MRACDRIESVGVDLGVWLWCGCVVLGGGLVGWGWECVWWGVGVWAWVGEGRGLGGGGGPWVCEAWEVAAWRGPPAWVELFQKAFFSFPFPVIFFLFFSFLSFLPLKLVIDSM